MLDETVAVEVEEASIVVPLFDAALDESAEVEELPPAHEAMKTAHKSKGMKLTILGCFIKQPLFTLIKKKGKDFIGASFKKQNPRRKKRDYGPGCLKSKRRGNREDTTALSSPLCPE